MSALLAIAWKEVRELMAGPRAAWGAAGGLLALGVIPVTLNGGAFAPTVLMIHLFSVPSMLSVLWAVESFAGERERATLDTLLASGIPGVSLVAGKLLVGVGGAWGVGLLAHGIARIVDHAFVRSGPGSPAIAPLCVLGFLMASTGGLVGTLGSLRAHTVREAMVRLLLPWLVVDTALRWMTMRFGGFGSRGASIAALAVIDALLVVALTLMFRRRRLLLRSPVRRTPSRPTELPRHRPGPAAHPPSLLRDVRTIVWKEMTTLRRMQVVSPWVTLALAVGVLLVVLPQLVAGQPDAWELPMYLTTIAVFLVPMLAPDVVTGERVRSTWETLRSARLDVRALFLGKALALWLFGVCFAAAMSLLTFVGLVLRRGWPDPVLCDWEIWAAILVCACTAGALFAVLSVGALCRTTSYKVAQVGAAAMCMVPLTLLGMADNASESGFVGTLDEGLLLRLVAPAAALVVVVALGGWRRFRVV